jgi:glycosyltransferase involved in cell wall biosynthesis
MPVANIDALRICVLGNAWSPHIQNRTRALAELGHVVTLLSADTADIPGVVVRQVSPSIRLPFCGWSILFRYLVEIRSLKPNVIHVHYASGFHAWVNLLLPQFPFIVSLMGRDILFEEQGNPTAASKRLTLDTLQQAALVTSKSEHINDYLKVVAPDVLEKTEIIRWGIDPEQFRPMDAHPLRRDLGIDADAPVVLCPRGFGPIYNIDTLIKSFADVRKQIANATLVLFEFRQDDEYRKRMDSIIEELGLKDHIIILGDIAHGDMPLYYNLADVVVSIPSSDGMPQSLFEALACESVAVISDLPHYREIVQDQKEVHMTPVSIEAVTCAILRLLEDAPTRSRLGRAGRQRVLEKANFNQDAKRVEKLLFEASKSHRTRKPYSRLRMAWLLFLHYAESVFTGKER